MCVFAAILSLTRKVERVSAFDTYSSFTFGSVPGGEPRFSFNGFNPGGLGQGGGGAVDNEGYYKVGLRTGHGYADLCFACGVEDTRHKTHTCRVTDWQYEYTHYKQTSHSLRLPIRWCPTKLASPLLLL